MDTTEIGNFGELMKKIKKPIFSYAYHYTSLGSLIKILESKTLQASRLNKMNDKFEERLYSNCKDYFFCLSKSSLAKENFGMWAMYGRLREIKCDDVNEKIGVKICFPKKEIDAICKLNGLKLHSVAYVDLREGYKGSPKKKVTIGSTTTKSKISLPIDKMAGYLKDSAWVYESEIRLRKKFSDDANELMDDYYYFTLSDEIISNLVVYPSPYYNISDLYCLRQYGIKIEKNIYNKTFG